MIRENKYRQKSVRLKVLHNFKNTYEGIKNVFIQNENGENV